jgi:hypothetical protein
MKANQILMSFKIPAFAVEQSPMIMGSSFNKEIMAMMVIWTGVFMALKGSVATSVIDKISGFGKSAAGWVASRAQYANIIPVPGASGGGLSLHGLGMMPKIAQNQWEQQDEKNTYDIAKKLGIKAEVQLSLKPDVADKLTKGTAQEFPAIQSAASNNDWGEVAKIFSGMGVAGNQTRAAVETLMKNPEFKTSLTESEIIKNINPYFEKASTTTEDKTGAGVLELKAEQDEAGKTTFKFNISGAPETFTLAKDGKLVAGDANTGKIKRIFKDAITENASESEIKKQANVLIRSIDDPDSKKVAINVLKEAIDSSTSGNGGKFTCKIEKDGKVEVKVVKDGVNESNGSK